MYLSLRDIVSIFIKTIFVILLSVALFYLIKFNIIFANYICEITNIPKDLALTVMSPGYANEIIILCTVFEIGIISFVFYKLSKITLLCNLYDKLMI